MNLWKIFELSMLMILTLAGNLLAQTVDARQSQGRPAGQQAGQPAPAAQPPRTITPPSNSVFIEPRDAWNDPGFNYRLLDPLRIAAEFGGGIHAFNDMNGQTQQGSGSILTKKEENIAGIFMFKFEISGRISRSETRDTYLVSRLAYKGRSEESPFSIRGDTNDNEKIGNTLLTDLTRPKILNRNETSLLTGIRFISRGGQFTYRGAYMTGIESRKWYEENLLWANRLEFDFAYRFSGALFGPFLGGELNVSLNSDEVSRAEGLTELGFRYVSDVQNSLLAQIDIFTYLSGGRWNDDTGESQATETQGIIGGGVRWRYRFLVLNLRLGYITNYGFEESLPSTLSTGLLERKISGKGDTDFFGSITLEF